MIAIFGRVGFLNIGAYIQYFQTTLRKQDPTKVVLDTDILLDTEYLNSASVMGVI